MMGTDTRCIDVLEAQEEGAAGVACKIVGKLCGIGVAKVQVTGGAGREAGDHFAEVFCRLGGDGGGLVRFLGGFEFGSFFGDDADEFVYCVIPIGEEFGSLFGVGFLCVELDEGLYLGDVL